MVPEIIIALDYNNFSEIKSIVDNLGKFVTFYKVGLEAFISIGKESLEYLKKQNKRIFLDLKLHDIPNTVKKAAVAAIENYKIDLLSIHIQGGIEMICETKKAINSIFSPVNNKPLLIGITVLTSLDDKYLKVNKIDFKNIQEYALHLANVGKNAGLDGVVCSVGEALSIKKLCGNSFKVVCPGIRFDKNKVDDQKRVYTPLDAKLSGADFIVIGRAVTESKEPINVVKKIIGELKHE